MPEVTAQTLLRGVLFALEQCARLLEDAVILFEHSRHATAAGVALLAREELGRHRILIDLWRKGQPVTVAEIQKACDDHVEKQTQAQFSYTFRAERGTQLGELIHARMTGVPGTPEHQKAEEQFRVIAERKRRRQPHERHETRMSALYVDPLSDGSGWSVPKRLPAKMCAEIVTEAINDYTSARDRIEHASPLYGDQALTAAIEALPELVNLPAPRHIPSEIMVALLA